MPPWAGSALPFVAPCAGTGAALPLFRPLGESEASILDMVVVQAQVRESKRRAEELTHSTKPILLLHIRRGFMKRVCNKKVYVCKALAIAPQHIKRGFMKRVCNKKVSVCEALALAPQHIKRGFMHRLCNKNVPQQGNNIGTISQVCAFVLKERKLSFTIIN